MFLHKLVHCVTEHHRRLGRVGAADLHLVGLTLISVGPFEETCRRLARADSALSRRIAHRLSAARGAIR